VAETADLKSLARLVLQRDTARDSERDRVSRRGLTVSTQPRHHHRLYSVPSVSAPYARALAALEARCPDCVPADRWQQAVEDGKRFLARWGKQAAALGWTARDLFGLHTPPENPHPSYSRLSRYDCTGLIWLLQGRRVTAMTESTARIGGATGNDTTYRRHNLGPLGDDFLPPFNKAPSAAG
jgi:hypothetical protein